jgi:hypothetical protein
MQQTNAKLHLLFPIIGPFSPLIAAKREKENMRAIRKVTSGELLTKQAMRKNVYKKYLHT